jgi:histidine triad (HIT) family protein
MNEKSQESKCLFCQFATGKIPTQKVYEDDFSLAFLDISPINKGHLLLIPKEHYANIHEIPQELFSKLAINIKKLATVVKETVSADGINIGMNNGEAAGQVIFHAHIHIIPRFDGDGYEHWKSQITYKDDEMKTLAEKISKNIS